MPFRQDYYPRVGVLVVSATLRPVSRLCIRRKLIPANFVPEEKGVSQRLVRAKIRHPRAIFTSPPASNVYICRRAWRAEVRNCARGFDRVYACIAVGWMW